MIYLDYAATSPLSEAAIQAMTTTMSETFGNPSSLHALGRQASKLLRESRQLLAQLLDANADAFIFTSGGTESNNLALKGYALSNQNKGKHIISSQMEHHAVLDVLAYLQERFDFDVTLLPPSEDGTISPQQVEEALRPDTILVSIMWANNETGHLNPIREIGDLLVHHQAAFHVDAVQVVGKLPISLNCLPIDFLSASAHKFYGPKGVGFLYAKTKSFDKLLHGGNQEAGRRASTENLIGISGMVAALAACTEQLDQHLATVHHLKQELLQQLSHPRITLNSPEEALPHVINLSIDGANNALLLTQMDLAGFAISSGSACTAGNVEPSHVLIALYGDKSPKITQSIRISLSHHTTLEEITAFATTLKKVIG
ncbi:cysteine desulfurase family protein [Streptococcus sp. E24BD]|uniref:cysteine desulfurase family protein n=1 Tax=Streptococcus sp. E24BD TaxID=3278715 RepID=UPI00359D138C